SQDHPRGCVGLLTESASRFRNLKVTDPENKVLFEGLHKLLPLPKAARAYPSEPSLVLTAPWIDSDDWVFKGNELHQPDESHNSHVALFGDPSWTDYDFEAEVQVNAGDFSEAGIVFRATRSNDRLYGSVGAFGNTAHALLGLRNGAGAFAQTPGKAEKDR